MTCRSIEADLVDLARGVIPDSERGAALERHVRDCLGCAARLEGERAISAGLRRLAEDAPRPPNDPDHERRALAAFDAAWVRPRMPESWRPQAAALTALAATLVWTIAKGRFEPRRLPSRASVSGLASSDAAKIELTPRGADTSPMAAPVRSSGARSARVRRPATTRAHTEETTFVMWPGANQLPRFESGQLMRVALPASVAVSLGLRPSPTDALVQTDVLVGQDGYARAVRLVP